MYKSLEDCYDQHVHPQKRLDIKRTLESVMGRLLEIKSFLVGANDPKSEHVNFDDILVDLKLIPEVLELPVPRYFRDERRTELGERWKLVEAIKKQIEAEKEAEGGEEGATDAVASAGGMSIDAAVRLIQINERGRQGRERSRAHIAVAKTEKAEGRVGSGTMDEDNAAILIQTMFRGFQTARLARKMREEELVFIGMQEPEVAADPDPVSVQKGYRARRKLIQSQFQEEYLQVWCGGDTAFSLCMTDTRLAGAHNYSKENV